MAYNIHIFRGSDWTDEPDEPITAEELKETEGVSILEQSTVKNPKTGLSVTIAADNMFVFKTGDTDILFMLDDNGMINVACRNEDVPEKIIPLAEALGAVIQGDEGEFYSLNEGDD